MSVYTEIDTPKITQLCSQFGVSVSTVEPIKAGVQNSNWFIGADDGKDFILTLFETETLEKVKSLTYVMKELEKSDLPVATPIAHESGLDYTDYQGKILQLYPRLEGEHPEYAGAIMAEQIGAAMGNMHDLLGTLDISKVIERTVDWDARRDQFMADFSLEDKKLIYKIWQKYNACTVGKNFNDLPYGLIHADLFFDNTLWVDDQLTGILDFTEVREDYLLMDIAVTANDFCTDWEDMEFDEDKLEYFLKGHNDVRSLTSYEEEVLPVFLAMAAVRFWLFRLNMIHINAENKREGENITVKSPDLMKQLALIHAEKI